MTEFIKHKKFISMYSEAISIVDFIARTVGRARVRPQSDRSGGSGCTSVKRPHRPDVAGGGSCCRAWWPAGVVAPRQPEHDETPSHIQAVTVTT